jgi:hypothetical protein
MIDSIWLYKIKHAADGSIEKYKAKFIAKDSLRKRELTMRRLLLQLQGILLLE